MSGSNSTIDLILNYQRHCSTNASYLITVNNIYNGIRLFYVIYKPFFFCYHLNILYLYVDHIVRELHDITWMFVY